MTDGFYGGLKQSIKTGEPLELVNKIKASLNEKKLESDANEGLKVEEYLATEPGQYFINLVEKKLDQRIDELVRNDPEASGLLSMMAMLGDKVVAGRMSAQKLIQMRLRRGEIKTFDSE